MSPGKIWMVLTEYTWLDIREHFLPVASQAGTVEAPERRVRELVGMLGITTPPRLAPAAPVQRLQMGLKLGHMSSGRKRILSPNLRWGT